MKKLVDLHVHSTSSDGIFKPAELAKIANDAGLMAFALADHDSIDGIDEAIAAADRLSIECIPAVELSVEYEKYSDVHLLGYFIDHKDEKFREMLSLFCERRESRGIRVVERINERLLAEGREPIDISDVMALAEGALGRPHIARVLIAKGYCTDMQNAFDSYLKQCNVPKEYLPFDRAVAEIIRTGGVPVLAHPQSISRDRSELLMIISDMAARGLGGIEACNTMGYQGDDSFLKKLADNMGLVATGGSDFHGGDEGLFMGRGRGDLTIDYSVVEALKAKRVSMAVAP